MMPEEKPANNFAEKKIYQIDLSFKNNNEPEQPEQKLKTDLNYWRSFEELYNNPEYLEASHHEFKSGVTDDFSPSELSPISRRKFLALLGASAALAGAGCADYRDKGDIIPYINRPEEVLPGKASYYASTCSACSNSCGILIKTREGRPVKVDGNPDHPVSKGKICAKGHADILNLYNPDRLKEPMSGGRGSLKASSWEKVDSEIINELNKAGDKQIALITHRIISPTEKKLLDDFISRFPSAKIYSYELFNEQNRNSAWRKSYGGGEFPLIKWNEAEIIVALEADFLGTEGNKVENARMYSEGRDIMNNVKFNRLYSVEGNLSLTGMNADYRIKLSPAYQHEFVLGLISEISEKTGAAPGSALDMKLNELIKKHSLSSKKINHLVNDLLSHRGSSFIYAGRTLPEEVHTAVNHLNEILGNSRLYRTDVSGVNLLPLSPDEDWKNLIDAMNNNVVAAVIHYDSNPVFHMPSDSGYKEALSKVPNVISISQMMNESCAAGDYILPVNHNFESWGDAKTRTGFYSLKQPVISPIFNTKQKEAVLLTWIEGKTSSDKAKIYHNYLMNNWEQSIFPALGSGLDFTKFWNASLHDGIVLSEETAASYGSYAPGAFTGSTPAATENNGYTVVLKESYTLGDGRFADNGWLQELPHPVTKITWDNFASLSKSSADELGLNSGDMIEIKVGERKLTVPVFIQPGAADKAVTIELGYGREKAGIVGTNVGFNANVLMSMNSALSHWLFNNAEIRKISGSYKFASTQEHHAFDEGFTKDIPKKRGLLRTGTLEEFKKNPEFLKSEKGIKQPTFYGQHLDTLYQGVKWGMSIDLNKCLGCGECVVACTSENNVPVVGKDQVERSREMHWLRIDRYYSGGYEDPDVFSQPMLCQHCDHAPCENVCPVAATTHSDDGLNQMAYNRCVGTRYCSNNCPYKVRRFNFYDFKDHFKNSFQENSIFTLLYNPEVSVRSRGVMEKCTFCVQRIMEAREEAIKENRPVKGSDVRTACQEACSTNAIQFGDMNDKENESEYSKYKDHPLGYYMLEELNTRPNITYIAKLKNIHPEES